MPFGKDIDDLFGYYTQKYVKVRDHRLGLLQKGLMLAIFVKIIGLTMFYKCQHLLPVPVHGSARAMAQQPTVDNCDPTDPTCKSNFKDLADLSYCSQYSEFKHGDAEEDGSPRKLKAEAQKNCVLWDAAAMTRGRSPVPGTLFLPTYIKIIKQKKGCDPNKGNHYHCDTKPWVRDGGDDAISEFHIGDVESFRLLVNNAFRADAPGISVTGRASDFNGFVRGDLDLTHYYTSSKGYIEKLELEEDKETKELKAVHKQHPILKGKLQEDSHFDETFEEDIGDWFSIDDLLTMADIRGSSMLDLERPDGTYMRQRGAVIQVEIDYNNKAKMDPFGETKPHYTIRARYLPMRYYNIMYEEARVGDKRELHQAHGLLFLIDVTGEIMCFDLTHLLTVLTTAMVSLAMATTLTDYIMQYCFSNSPNYSALKFQITQDFSDFNERKGLLIAGGKKAGSWDQATEKPGACGHLVRKVATGQAGKDLDQDVKDILCFFEQRLNRLDGTDVTEQAGVPNLAEDAALDRTKKATEAYTKEIGGTVKGAE